MSDRKRRQWLKVLLWLGVALASILSAGVPGVPLDVSGGPARIPPSWSRLAQIDPSSSSEVLKAFKQSVDNYTSEKYASALEALPTEQNAKTTDIGDYILLYRARSNLMLERNKEALEGFRLLEKDYPDSPLIREALMGECQALLNLTDAKTVLTILKNPKISQDSESIFYQARALELDRDKEKSLDLYLIIYSRYPKSRFSDLAERRLLLLSPGALRGKRNYSARLQRAENLLQAKDAGEARKLLMELGRVSAPDSRSAQKQTLLLADAEYRLGRTSSALTRLRKVTAADPALHAKAIRLEGICYRKLGREKLLLAQRDKALRLYPQSPETEELCYSAATYFDLNYDLKRSRESYELLLRQFPKGRYAERVLWISAIAPYFEKDYSEAARRIWHYLLAYRNPGLASSATYWLGRCYEGLGNFKNARILYERTQALANEDYYGLCARQAAESLGKSGQNDGLSISGIDFAQVLSTCDGLRPPSIVLTEPNKDSVRIIERARQLWAADLPDMAASELRWGSRQFPKDERPFFYIVSRIYTSKENYGAAISGMSRVFPDYGNRPIDSLPEEVWQLLFPVCHWNIISARSGRIKLDPTLVLGLIRQESAFNYKARSVAGARGLMQILPSTGRMLARQARIPRYSSQKLYQPETNITLGIHHLDYLIRHYGKIELALAAYNAGNSRVDRWLKEFGDVDMAEFVERIPFSETRGYIKKVLSNQARYRLLTSASALAGR